jgi:molybdenum cofactor cytidylyltransferase
MSVSIIILAAGSSSRLGFPKQLLKVGEKTLILHITEVALSTGKQVSIVLGANTEKIEPEISNLSVQIIKNPNWKEGMASSLRAGLQSVDLASTDGILVMLCDQIFTDKSLLDALIQTFETQKPLAVCSEYDYQKGVPAIFSKTLFDEIMQLQGDKGAKSIIKKYENQIPGIPFPKGNIDIDTQEDIEKWQQLSY